MPTHKSAAKRIKTAAAARHRNRRVRSAIRIGIKSLEDEKDSAKRTEKTAALASIVDKAARKKVIHKNRAARIKSRLARKKKSK